MMSVTLDIPDRLADLLRALATQRGVSVEELGEQALTVGLTTLAAAPAAIVDLDPARGEQTPRGTVAMPSPLLARGPVRPLQIIFEPDPESAADAH
jgi:hypothetical protein